MQAAPPDDAASAPSDPPPGAAGEAGLAAAGLLRRVGVWVRRLSSIGADLTERLGWLADRRAKTGPVEGGVDLQLGWALVSRAARWTRALRTRLRAMALAVKAPAPLPGRDAPRDGVGRVPLGPPGKARPLRYGSTHCIAGMKTHEVVAQICADLAEAATLLQARKAERRIVRIAKAAWALLAGPDKTWTKLPPPPVYSDGAVAEPAGQDAPKRLDAPDSG